jgi:hypothetical protein
MNCWHEVGLQVGLCGIVITPTKRRKKERKKMACYEVLLGTLDLDRLVGMM